MSKYLASIIDIINHDVSVEKVRSSNEKIMSLMMLGAKKEHTLSFTVEGEDEEACAAALEAFLKENL